MAKTYKGRVIAGGNLTGEAIVSHQGLNTLATFQKSALKNAKKIIGSDQNNPDVYGKVLTGKILCLPMTIGSTTGGLVIQTICQKTRRIGLSHSRTDRCPMALSPQDSDRWRFPRFCRRAYPM